MLEQSSQWIEQHLSRKAVELEKERLICHDVCGLL
jgi:hypothetical protein